MSEFNYQLDDCNMICPYCEHSYQVEAEDYSEDERVEECGECGMKYHAYQSFSVTNHSSPDCALNDRAHEWQVRKDPNFEHCDICEQCREVKHEQ